MDGDLRLDLFSWDLYRAVLAALEPLVSQPSVVAKGPGMRSTDKHKLRMTGRIRGLFPVAREVERTETMAPLISTRLWGALRERLQQSDNRTVWYLNDLWDMAAYLSAAECGRAGVLLINASPVRHMDYHDLLEPAKVGRSFSCLRGCGAAGANCRPLAEAEARLLREGLRGFCDVAGSPHLACGAQLNECYRGLVRGVQRRAWAQADNGTILSSAYVCKHANGSWRSRLEDDCEFADA
mmetsp:Transcript_99853/g.321957  ORF Transcript_99853/g.321957 Transcript_99853/m.321957 type:complete len:239 (+) Transcript_99853:1-717(+)